jgi:hypothetical protein
LYVEFKDTILERNVITLGLRSVHGPPDISGGEREEREKVYERERYYIHTYPSKVLVVYPQKLVNIFVVQRDFFVTHYTVVTFIIRIFIRHEHRALSL